MTLIRAGTVIVMGGLVANLIHIASSAAASFNCSHATTVREQMICSDPELSALDDQLSIAYKAAIDGRANPEIRAEQRLWLRKSNECRDLSCLREGYKERIGVLRALPPRPDSAVSNPAEPQRSSSTASSGDLRVDAVEAGSADGSDPMNSDPPPLTQPATPETTVPADLGVGSQKPAATPLGPALPPLEARAANGNASLNGAEHRPGNILRLLLLFLLTQLPQIPLWLRIRVLMKGTVVDIESDEFSFPGGSIDANAFSDYFRPGYWLQLFKHFTIRLSDIQMINASETTTVKTDKDGNIKTFENYLLEIRGNFGSATISFASNKGKRDQLFNALRVANRMGTPVVDAHR